jgi:hypothetical protein
MVYAVVVVVVDANLVFRLEDPKNFFSFWVVCGSALVEPIHHHVKMCQSLQEGPALFYAIYRKRNLEYYTIYAVSLSTCLGNAKRSRNS